MRYTRKLRGGRGGSDQRTCGNEVLGKKRREKIDQISNNLVDEGSQALRNYCFKGGRGFKNRYSKSSYM